MEIIWSWHPKIGLGPFKLGTNIDAYLRNYNLFPNNTEEDDGTNWDSYKISGVDTFIDVENGVIESIRSFEFFYYMGKNLIGLTLEELNQKLPNSAKEKGDSVEYEDGDIQTPYDYDDLGLQIWLSKNRVVSAICINL